MALDARTGSLQAQSAFLIAGRLAGFVFAFAIPIVLVRALDQAEFGTYKQFFLIGGLLVSALPLGLDASLFFFIPRDSRRAGHYLAQAVLWCMGLGLAAALGLWLVQDRVGASLNSPQLAQLIPLLGVFLVFELGGQLLERLVIIEAQSRLAALVTATTDAVRAVTLIVPALLTGHVYWVVAGAAVYAVLRFLALVGWVAWQYRDRFTAGWRPVELRAQVFYALPFGVAGLVQNVLIRYHALYVASAVPPAQFAIYAVGSQQIAPVQIFFRSLFEVALVRMTEHFGAGRYDAMRDLWHKLIARQAALIVPLVVVMCLLADAFVTGVYTAQFAAAVPVFRVSLLLMLLTMINDHAVLRAVGSTRFILLANAVGLAVALPAVPLLTRTLGMFGAALALVLAVAVTKGLGLARLGQRLRIPARKVLPWRALAGYGAAALLAAGLVYPTVALLHAPLVRFFGCGALFWLLYLAIGWAGALFPAADRSELLRVVQVWRLARRSAAQ